jgi:hypothetical protein
MGQGYFYGKPADSVTTLRYLAEKYHETGPALSVAV